MRRPLFAVLCSLVGSASAWAGQDSPAAPPRLDYGDPITYRNITLIPVMSDGGGPFQRYTLLEQGLAKKSFRIRERAGESAQAAVEEVEVKNSGEDPVFLLGGEMILGGQQDRIISADTVVPNDKRWHRVKVFCVEQGRWSGKKMFFEGGGAVAHLKLQEAAMSGRQDQVWAEVARKNAEHGTTNETQTYRRTIQNAAVRKKIATYRGELDKLLPSRPISGMIFAINGEIQVADLLDNPLLFGSLREKLLSAYILEAIEHQVDPNARRIDKKIGKSFVDDAEAAPSSEGIGGLGTRGVKKESKDTIGNETWDLQTGKTVRRTYINKKKKK